MEIRAKKRQLEKIKKALEKSGLKGITLTEEPVKDPQLLILSGGEFILKASGFQQVLGFARLGYVPVLRRCPHRRHRKCIGSACARFWVMRGTGDCGYFWDLQLKTEGL